MPKARSGKATLAEYNPEIRVNALEARAEGELLERLVAKPTVVLDCCDNFATRHAVNRLRPPQTAAGVGGGDPLRWR